MAAHSEGHPEDSYEFHAAVHKHFHHEIGTLHSDKLVDQGTMRPPEPEPELEPEKMSRSGSRYNAAQARRWNGPDGAPLVVPGLRVVPPLLCSDITSEISFVGGKASVKAA